VLAAVYVLAAAALWALLPALLQSVPHADNIEQLSWAHALQWGYVKHPPLPTWLLHAALRLFRPGALLTYALATACAALTLLLVWRCARLVLGPEAALVALLLSSANYYLMGRASYFNHNTVMLPFVAASAWAVLRIASGGAPWSVWLLLGLAQAGGLLTKYQMGVIALANLLALLGAGAAREPRFARHALLAAAATLLPLIPHLLWLQRNEFSSFAYAGHSLLAGLPVLDRVRLALGFLAQQVGRFAPAIVAAGLVLLAGRAGIASARGTAPDAPGADPQRRRALDRALLVLACAPLACVLLMGLLGGVALQNHWGASTTLLLPLLAVARASALRKAAPGAVLGAVCAVQLAAVSWSVAVARRSQEFHYTFPAQALADQAQRYWEQHAAGSPAIIAGPDWEAGSISLELPSHPDVLASGDRRQAPWVDDARLQRCGVLVVWRPEEPPGAQVGAALADALQHPAELRATGANGRAWALRAGIIPPQGDGC
jgi:4-amino-4-deoxy-L-arabinose transferase-like glycosyltransferase